MYCHTLRRFFCAFAVLIFCPLAAGAQTSFGAVNDGSSLEKSVSSAPSTHLSDNLQQQDTTFIALIKARDDALAVLSELKRITAYHDRLKSGMGSLFSSLSSRSRDAVIKLLEAELQRLKKFEDDINASTDAKTKVELSKKFDVAFPVDIRRSRPLRRSSGLFVRNISDAGDVTASDFVRRERSNANQVFQNVSFANRQFLDRYERVFSTVESFGNENMSTPILDELPDDFSELAGAPSFDALTPTQIKSAITKYRDALQRTRDSLAASAGESAETVRTRLTTQLDTLGQELFARSADVTGQMSGLEKNIILTAKSTYGKAVGAESFNYLLIVFATVFVVIMIVPRFYSQTVAENVLKSEFLLQFSTVFVLIAAIIILAIGGFIEKNQLPVLLAGISGYVLGQLGSNTGQAVPARPPAVIADSRSG